MQQFRKRGSSSRLGSGSRRERTSPERKDNQRPREERAVTRGGYAQTHLAHIDFEGPRGDFPKPHQIQETGNRIVQQRPTKGVEKPLPAFSAFDWLNRSSGGKPLPKTPTSAQDDAASPTVGGSNSKSASVKSAAKLGRDAASMFRSRVVPKTRLSLPVRVDSPADYLRGFRVSVKVIPMTMEYPSELYEKLTEERWARSTAIIAYKKTIDPAVEKQSAFNRRDEGLVAIQKKQREGNMYGNLKRYNPDNLIYLHDVILSNNACFVISEYIDISLPDIINGPHGDLRREAAYVCKQVGHSLRSPLRPAAEDFRTRWPAAWRGCTDN